MTNGDLIRTATNEEIAYWITEYAMSECPAAPKCHNGDFDSCEAAWLDWLNTEISEDEEDYGDVCYECGGYGDDYYYDDSGELVCACDDCWVTRRLEDDDD